MIEIEKAKETLKAGISLLGLQPSVKILEIKFGHVLVLDYNQDPEYPLFHTKMIQLERWMKAWMKVPELELQLESIEDKNRREVRSGRQPEKLVSARNVESLQVNE